MVKSPNVNYFMREGPPFSHDYFQRGHLKTMFWFCRLSPWVTKPPSGVSQKVSTALSPLPLPDAQDMDWPSLVDTATRAMLTVSDSAESIDQGVSSSGGVNSLPNADNEPLAHWVDNVAERLGLDT